MTALAALIQWVALASLVALIGAAAVDLFVLPSGVAEIDAARRPLRHWTGVNVVALVVASVGHLLIRTRTMSGGDLGTIVTAMPSVLTHTHFGTIWIARFTALAAVAVVWPVSSKLARPVIFLLAAGLGLTTTLTGHASDWGDFSVSTLVDYGHVLGAGIWMGGLFALALVIFPRVSGWPDALIATVVRRFSRLAGLCLALVVLSGTYNAWAQVRVWTALWTTTYGRVLLAKIVFVLVVAALGAVNRFAILPGFAGRSWLVAHVTRTMSHVTATTPSASSQHLRARLVRYVAAEAALGLVILLCTGVLTETTPGRHAIRMQHQGHSSAQD
ncbi:MAG: hypothetical protein C5B48_06500 [Candidatus Rokuibacteriota bacterium]|nr:MAG: hypothetical protein C5B48_06500 [Candidatus Rokubacteria bacterium]